MAVSHTASPISRWLSARSRTGTPATDPQTAQDQATVVWSPATRIAFRFVFVLIALLYLPWPFYGLPVPPFVDWYNWAFARAFHWGVTSVLQLDPTVWGVTERGQTAGFRAKAMAVFFSMCIATVVTAIWTALDRKSLAYPRLHEGMRIVIRLFLIAGWFSFGLEKMIPLQTPFPSVGGMMRPFGTSTGASGIAWMIGFSGTYAMFTGWAEFACGFFLCFRRTITLGALLTVGTMAHVLAYVAGGMIWMQGVEFLLPALVLLAPDAKRLVDLFWFRRPTSPSRQVGLFRNRRLNVAVRTVGVAYVLYLFVGFLADKGPRYKEQTYLPPLWGVYEVEDFVRDGRSVPPLLTDSSRWRRLAIGERWNSGTATVRSMTNASQSFQIAVDTTARTLTLGAAAPPRPRSGSPAPAGETLARFAYSSSEDGTLLLAGTLGQDSLRMKLRRVDEQAFPLVRESWSWDRVPYNRPAAHK